MLLSTGLSKCAASMRRQRSNDFCIRNFLHTAQALPMALYCPYSSLVFSPLNPLSQYSPLCL